MIISKTPLRISFAGGGSDLKDYYLRHGGCVVSSSINKYVYLSLHKFFDETKCLLKYSKTELIDNIDKIEHPIIREVFKDYDMMGVDFSSNADVPAGTGLGSSSAFTTSLITLCNAHTSKYMTKEAIAKKACDIEIERLKEPIGKQDQYACAIGGLNFLTFNPDDTVTVEHIFLNKDTLKQLQNRLVMFYTGRTRSASDILVNQKSNTVENKNIDNLYRIEILAKMLHDELRVGRIESFGEVLQAGWSYKKEIANGISDNNIDKIYEQALSNGAEGGKLLGAGGGGFLLFYVKEENKDRLIKSLDGLQEFPFEFENVGTTIIYHN